MANHTSAKKSIRQNIRRRTINKSRITRIKTFEKKVLFAIKEGKDLNFINDVFKIAQSEIMRGVGKKVLKLNTASRKVSVLSQKVKGAFNITNKMEQVL